jgi:hypothetical protein
VHKGYLVRETFLCEIMILVLCNNHQNQYKIFLNFHFQTTKKKKKSTRSYSLPYNLLNCTYLSRRIDTSSQEKIHPCYRYPPVTITLSANKNCMRIFLSAFSIIIIIIITFVSVLYYLR